ncbi:carbohydrate-binding protein [Solibaculum mannosilyticum]|uniref:carbohydrate-binding protein n=1 Tax=Solibaculum mannosilyticum TaxID=2780922 RepID=UPI0034B84005
MRKATQKALSMALCLSFLATSAIPAVTASAEDGNSKPKLYAVANSHLDTAWNWPLETSIQSYIPNTIKQNIELLKKYPEFNMNWEGVYRYELVKQYYPDLYEELKTWIDAGRWFPTGSVYENGDVNVPSPEALMRNILYGNKFLEEEFGMVNTDIYLPDCFGYGYALPSIASHMGLLSFSGNKLKWSNDNYLPFDLGNWVGPDGSTIVASLNCESYLSGFDSDINIGSKGQSWLENIMSPYTGLSGSDIARRIKYYGTGDVGGGVGEDKVKNLVEAMARNNTDGLFEVVSAYGGQMVEEMTEAEKAALETYNGELQMRWHGNGTWTGQALQKYLNRKSELLADKTERSASAAAWLGVNDYPAEKLKAAWKRVVALQHHDVLPGTSIAEVYEQATNDYIIALNQFAEEYETAAGGIASTMDTRVAEGVPIVVNNPVSEDRNEPVEAEVTMEEATQYVRVYDASGKEVPSQVLSTDGNKVKVLFLGAAPSNGYSVYNVKASDSPCDMETGLSITNNTLENNRYKVEINENGDISSIYDKENDKEILEAPITLQQFGNHVSNYGAWEISLDDWEKGVTSEVGGENLKVTIEENGPVRVALKVERTHRASSFAQTIELSIGDTEDRVDVDNEVMYGERSSYMKAAFPVTVSNENATWDLGLGTIERDTDDEYQYEMVGQQWADLTDEDGSYGVTIMNDSKYGWDKPDDNTLRLTLFHVPEKERNSSKADRRDFGDNRFTYSIMGHTGDWREGRSQYMAQNLNQPMTAVQTTSHAGTMGSEFSFASLNTDQAMIKAIKKAEDTDEIIVRVYELYGQDAEGVTLSMGDGIESFRETNGYETSVSDSTAKLVDGKLVFDMGAYTPKTFAVKLKDKDTSAVTPTYQSIDLNSQFNKDIISFDSNRSDGGFGENGYTFPGELMPESITTGGVTFQLGSSEDGKNNAIEAAGQTIALPEGTTKVHLLAGSQGDDADFTIKVGDQDQVISVQNMWNYVGEWDQYCLNRYGGIKRDAIGLLVDHTHKPSEDRYNDHGYLFDYTIDIPEGVTSITLPEDSNLIVAAATAQTNETYDSFITSPLYPEKEEAAVHTLSVEGVDADLVTGIGEYRTGNPVSINYKGEAADVTWIGSNGTTYEGASIQINMPDEDLTLTPVITPFESEDLAKGKTVKASGETKASEAASMAVDGDDTTKWCDTTSGNKWLEVELGEPMVIDTYVLKNAGFGGETEAWNTADWQIQVKDEDGNWVTVDQVSENPLDSYTGKIRPVYTQYVRLYITAPTRQPTGNSAARIYGFELYQQGDYEGQVVVSNPTLQMGKGGQNVKVTLPAYSDKEGNKVTISAVVKDEKGQIKLDKKQDVALGSNGWDTYTQYVDLYDAVGGIAKTDTLELVILNAEGEEISDVMTVENLGDITFADPFQRLEAEDYSTWSGGNLKVENSTTSEGETIRNIGGTYPNAWIAYQNMDFDTGANMLSIRYANNSGRCKSDAKIEVRLGSEDGKLVGTIDIPATGSDWSIYGTATGKLDETITGVQDVYLVMRGTTPDSNPYIANFDYFQFNYERDAFSTIENEDYDEWSGGGLKTEAGDNGTVLAGTYNNAWVKFDNVNFGDGAKAASIRYCAAESRCAADSRVEIRLDSVDGPLAGTIQTPPTASGWGTFTTVEGGLDQTVSGVHDVYFVMKGATDSSHPYIGNFNNFVFIEGQAVEKQVQRVEFEDYADWKDSAMKTEAGGTGTVVANTYPNDWLHYTVDVGNNSMTEITVNYSNNSGRCKTDAKVEVRLGAPDGELIGTVQTPPTASSWGTFGTASTVLSKPITGKQDIYLVLVGTTPDSNPYIGNFDYFELKGEEIPETPASVGVEFEDYADWKDSAMKTEAGGTGTVVANTYPGDWLHYTVDLGNNSMDEVAINYSNNSNRCKTDAYVEVRLGSPDGELVGTVQTPPTASSWGTFSTATASLNKTLTGKQEIYLVLKGTTPDGNPYIGNFDYFELKGVKNPDVSIDSVGDVEGKTVPYGTAFEDLDLPETVNVALSDGSNREVEVQWQQGDYDANTAGTYTLNGTLVLTEGILNPQELSASIQVTVEEKVQTDEFSIDFEKDYYQVNEEMTVTVVTPKDVNNIQVVNERGNAISTLKLSSIFDGQKKIWTMTIKVGSTGNRTFGLKAYQNGAWAMTDVTDQVTVGNMPIDTEVKPFIYKADFSATEAKVNETFTATVVTSTSIDKLAIVNERGKYVSFKQVGYEDQGDKRTWTVELSVGSAGFRILSFKAADVNGNWLPQTAECSIKITK